MFEEVADEEVRESICGIYLLVVKPGDPFAMRVNVRIPSDPMHFAK